MGKELDEGIKTAIHATIAKEVLGALDTEHRDALLQSAIAETIGGWSFRNHVEKVVAARAEEIATQLVHTEEWSSRIENAIRLGFDDYLRYLRTAVAKSVQNNMHGELHEGYRSVSAGDILKHWPKEAKHGP